MNVFKKYFQVFVISWEQGLVYRLNFTLWRVRAVLQLILVYFIWQSVFLNQTDVFGYSQSNIMTYILVSSVVRAIVLSSRATDLMNHINEGSIVNFLVRPLDIIRFYFSRDLADKLLNIFFVVLEVSLIIWIFHPPVILQTNFFILMQFAIAIILAVLLNFFSSLLISMMSFWVENSWGPLFLMMIILEGLGGGLFPIDILPHKIFSFLMYTPFPYLLYFPAKVYLGVLSTGEILHGFGVLCIWVGLMFLIAKKTLSAGLKHYTAGGG